MKTAFLLLFIGLVPLVGLAQKQDAFILPLDGSEMLTGTIKVEKDAWQGVVLRQERIRFYHLGKKKIYKPHQIKGYGIVKDSTVTLFLSQPVPAGKPHFLEVLADGPVTYYRYFWADMNLQLVEDFFLQKKGETELFRPKQLKRDKSLADYLSACPEVSNAILSKTYTGDVLQMVKQYNRCMAE